MTNKVLRELEVACLDEFDILGSMTDEDIDAFIQSVEESREMTEGIFYADGEEHECVVYEESEYNDHKAIAFKDENGWTIVYSERYTPDEFEVIKDTIIF